MIVGACDLLYLCVVYGVSVNSENNLVQVVRSVVHVFRCQTNSSGTPSANLKRRPGFVAERDVETDVIPSTRCYVLFCHRRNVFMTAGPYSGSAK